MDASPLQRLDLPKLSANLGDDRDTVIAMLDLYLSTTEKTLANLESAEREKNVLLWLQACHHLKGASQNITARRMAGLSIEAEEIRSLPHPQTTSVLYSIF